MAYVNPNFKTKKALREALAEGKEVEVYDPGIGLARIPNNGTVYLEGPHEYHRWYAQGTIRDGKLVSIK